MPGISVPRIAIPFKGKGGINYAAYWTTQPEVLFFGLYSEILGGQMPNKVTGATDYLTVAGAAGSETYQAPDTAPYIAADTDHIWFKDDETQRTVTTAELIGYDLQRTPVKYDDDSPNAVEAIIILSDAVTGDQRDKLFRDMALPILWDNDINAFGHIKSNRTTQNLFPGTPIGLTLTLISGGVKIDWTDNSQGLGETEIWGRSDSAESALLYTIEAGTVTKSETIDPVDLRYYKVRNKQDGIFSEFSAEESIAMLGSEMVVNGDFTSSDGWTAQAGWTITGGQLVGNLANNNATYRTVSFINGERYRFRINLVAYTSGRVNVILGGASDDQNNIMVGYSAPPGVKTTYVTRVGTGQFVYIKSPGAFVGTVDDLSIKKVLFP